MFRVAWFRSWSACVIFALVLILNGFNRALASVPGSSQFVSSGDSIKIYNLSRTEQTNRPVSVPRAFVQGEILNYAQAIVDGAPLLTQCDVKNRWPDGSLKYAIVSFVVPLIPATRFLPVSFSNQLSGNNTDFLNQAGMLDSAFDFEAKIQMTGAMVQNVSARQMLSNGAFRYWLQGPIVTAVIIEDRTKARTYDRDFGDGSKALHPIYEAWFYPQNHKVQVGYTVENTWASSNSATDARDEAYDLTLTAGLMSPQTVFTNSKFTHIGLSRWHQTFWVNGNPPGIRVDHNVQYLVQTRAIPNYDTSLTVSSNLIATKYDYWMKSSHLLQGDYKGIGNYDKALDAGGAADWLGPMDTWDVLYLLTMDERMLAASRGNADLAGRLPWHFREADTKAGAGHFFDASRDGSEDTFGHVVSVNAREQVTLSDLIPNQCGNDAPDDIFLGSVTTDGWGGHLSRGHIPDVAYIPYLFSGQYYYLEELQYEAAYIIGNKIGCYAPALGYPRQGNAGYLNDTEVRGDAWGFRTLAYAAFISPDSSPEKAYFEDKLNNNIALWEGRRNLPLTQPTRRKHWSFGYNVQRDRQGGDSPLGTWIDRPADFVQQPLKTDGSLLSAASPWEEGFMVYSLGMARDFGYDTASLLQFISKRFINQCLNPGTNHLLVEAYRYPTKLASTKTWIQDWPTNDSEYAILPTHWNTTSESADHSYGFIFMAAVGMVYPYTDPTTGYTGSAAWDWIRTNKPNQGLFSTASPKWDILPRKK